VARYKLTDGDKVVAYPLLGDAAVVLARLANGQQVYQEGTLTRAAARSRVAAILEKGSINLGKWVEQHESYAHAQEEAQSLAADYLEAGYQ